MWRGQGEEMLARHRLGTQEVGEARAAFARVAPSARRH
jgi:hypothetical protein